MIQCKRRGCQQPAAKDQAYCSRDCAPWGRLTERSSAEAERDALQRLRELHRKQRKVIEINKGK